MAVLVRGGTVVNADRSFRADVLCEGGKIVAVGEGHRCAHRGRDRRGRRRLCDPRRHRPAHPHGDALHGHGGGRGLLLGHRLGAGRRHHHADRHVPGLAAEPDRGARPVVGVGEEGLRRLRLPRRDLRLVRPHAAADGRMHRSRRQQLQALHGLQRGLDDRRRDHVPELLALPRAGCPAAGPRRERRGRVPPAAVAAGAGDHRPGRARPVAPAACRGRGRQPGDHAGQDHRRAALHRPHLLPRDHGSHRAGAGRRPARVRRAPGPVPGAGRERLSEPRLGVRGLAGDEPALPLQGAPEGAVGRPRLGRAPDHGHRPLPPSRSSRRGWARTTSPRSPTGPAAWRSG